MNLLRLHKHLSIQDSNLLKGIAILLIGFHNFYRNVPPHFGENEFYFKREHLPDWLHYISENPVEIFMSFCSFLGHYGVSAFILISGYGLALGYKHKKLSYFSFVFSRFRKIYPTFFLGVAVCVFLTVFKDGISNQETLWQGVFWKLSLLSPFNQEMLFALQGPWWFFGLIFQLYALFPLLLFLLKKNLKGIFASLLFVLLILPHTPFIHGTETYYASALYQLPLFGLGVFLGYRKELTLPSFVFVPAFAVFLVAQGNPVFWKLSHLCASILLLCLALWLRNRSWKLNKLLVFAGGISFHFFAFHPLVRPPFIELAENIGSPYGTTVLGFVFVAFAMCTALLFQAADKRFREFFKKQLSQK